MSDQIVSRVHYFDKQFLRVSEFGDEQLYQLTLRRRHNVAEHSWGIVSGLEIAQENGGLVVRPGLAIDGYGREVLLADKKSLNVDDFDTLGSDRLDVWIVYDRRDTSEAPKGYDSCMPSAASYAYRSDEIPQILVERPINNTVDARQPPGVPANALNAPVPVMSDDPGDTWRIYLGRVTRANLGNFVIDGSSRTYAGLVGEVIDHPANPARVEVGKQSRVDDSRVIDGITYTYERGDDPLTGQSRRFAVFVPEDHLASDSTSTMLAPRFEILQDGTIRLRGQTLVNGSVRIAGGALEFRDGNKFTADNAPADPSIYRYKDAGSGAKEVSGSFDARDELRIDLGSADTLQKQFVIGFSGSDGSFSPCLTIQLEDDGTGALVPLMTIAGDLMVQGKLSGRYVPRNISKEALAALLGSFQAGVAAGNVGH